MRVFSQNGRKIPRGQLRQGTEGGVQSGTAAHYHHDGHQEEGRNAHALCHRLRRVRYIFKTGKHGVYTDQGEQGDCQESQKARHGEALQHLLFLADESTVGEYRIMESIGQALQQCAQDEIHAGIHLPGSAGQVRAHRVCRQNPEKGEYQQYHEQSCLQHVGNQGRTQSAPAAVAQCDCGKKKCGDDEGFAARLAVVSADDRGVGPYLVEQTNQNRCAETECCCHTVVACEEVGHGFCGETTAKSVDGKSGEGNAEPVYRVADSAHDAVAVSHIGAVIYGFCENPSDKYRRGDHQGRGCASLLVGSFEKAADCNGLRGDGEHDDAVYHQETPEKQSCTVVHDVLSFPFYCIEINKISP